MTNRERIYRLARGLPIDRVPFAQYRNIAAPDDEIWSAVGRANMSIIIWSRVHKLTYGRCSAEEERFNRIRYGKHSRVDNPDDLPEQAIAWCLS